MSQSILNLVYPPEEIFVRNWTFNDEKIAIEVACVVPSSRHYAVKPIPYVTTENYVRCLSQSSFLLSEYILENSLVSIDIPADFFRKAAADYELYYRYLSMTFHHRVARDEEFRMRLVLKNWKEIKRMQDFILFTFTNERTVISGEMSFVFLGG